MSVKHLIRILEQNTHFNSNGCIWTKKYKPIELVKITDNRHDYDEDKYTLKHTEEYEINNVRGESFNQIKLSNENIFTINQIFKTYNKQCYICCSSAHFASNCEKQNNNKIKYELNI